MNYPGLRSFYACIIIFVVSSFYCCSSIESYDERVNCHEDKNYDEAAFQSALIGRWQWVRMDCTGSGINANYNDLAIEFTDSEIIIYEGNKETARSTYEIVMMGNGEFWIVDAGDFPVTGRANYLCDNELVMDGSLDLDCVVLYQRG